MLEGERIGLVEKDHAPPLLLGHGEDLLEDLARVGTELGGQVHELQVIEDARRLGGEGAGEQGLAGSGRAVEQHALGRRDAPLAVELGIRERRGEAPHDALGFAQAADLGEGHVGFDLHHHAPGQIAELFPELGEDVVDAPLDRPLLAVEVTLVCRRARARNLVRSHRLDARR